MYQWMDTWDIYLVSGSTADELVRESSLVRSLVVLR